MYQVLYRKWRPKVFEDVIGQPQVTTTLKNELKNNRINHAYLFTGSRGTGKTTCAKILAKAVNCLDLQNGDPCGECENCKGIEEGQILDVVEMDAASNRGIADIKTIIEEAQFRPAKGKYRVYIVDEVHMLTTEAFNALLKTLEEPPEHVIFILATTEVHKLPTTILSRCQRFDFHRIAPENIAYRLDYVAKQENANITEDAAKLIAAIADGAMRDSLSLMDRCLSVTSEIDTETVRKTAGLAQKDYLFRLATCCINKNTSLALEIISDLHAESKDMSRLCNELLDHFRTLMLIKSTKNPQNLVVMSQDEFEQAQTQADYLTLAEIIFMMDILQVAYSRMGKGNSDRTEFEMGIVKLSAPELEADYHALAARVSALEKVVKSGKITVTTQQIPQPEQPAQQTAPQPVTQAPQQITQQVTEAPQATEKTAPENQVQPEKPEPVPQSNSVPEPSQQTSENIPAPAENQPQEISAEKPISQPEKAPQPAPIVQTPKINLEEIYNNAKPFRQWPEVVENIKKYSKAIAGAFTNTNAYESGNYLLIDASTDIPFQLLKESAQRANVRTAIQEITGRVYKLGPYKRPEAVQQEKSDPLKDLVQNLKENNINVTEE